MLSARCRLASLWLSQVARVLADNCLRIFVVLEVAQGGPHPGPALAEGGAEGAAWHQVTPFFILPFVLLAPLNGALSNGLPKRWVLVGSSAFCFGVAVCFGTFVGLSADPWLWCLGLGLVAVGAAIYSPARYALLPAAAEDAQLPLSRVNGLIEMGGAAAVVAGLLLGLYLHRTSWRQIADNVGAGEGLALWASGLQQSGIPPPVAATVVLNAMALLTALPVRFPSDVRRPEPPRQAVAGFFRDCARVWRDRDARGSMLALACFLGLVTVGSGVVFAYTGGLRGLAGTAALSHAIILIALGTAAGALLAGVEGHLRRALGLVPFGITGLLIALAWAMASSAGALPCLLLGLMAGLVTVPLRAFYQAVVPADARGNAMAVQNSVYYALTTIMAVLMFALARSEAVSLSGQLALLVALAAVGAAAAWWFLFRESFELLLEVLLWPIYRIHGHGPGLQRVPLRGPLLVVANHTTWLDPAFLGKVLPRRLIAMMTSQYYDLPVIRWLMVHVFHTIRVEVATFRREVPELEQAVSALDRGECVLIFPEGAMKRRAEQALRQFGQGVWHILRERRATPVVVCWIEGGWGSYFSYSGGRPTVNKRLDWWRHIEVAVSEAQVLDPALLADQRATRAHLMQACLAARRHLGLEALPAQQASHEQPVFSGEEPE